jgi:hypothetical protein
MWLEPFASAEISLKLLLLLTAPQHRTAMMHYITASPLVLDLALLRQFQLGLRCFDDNW